MTVEFDNYDYSPLVRSRRAELVGYKNLTAEIKRQILPVFILGKWPKSDDIRDSMKKCAEVVGDNPFVIDTTRLAEHRGDGGKGFTVHDLVEPARAFKAWRDFLSEFEESTNLIPTVQLHGEANPRDIMQQTLQLEEDYGQIALRVNAAKGKQLDITMFALGAMKDPGNAIVYIDLGFITEGNMPAQERAAVTSINSLRSVASMVNIVLCGSSFPSSVVAHGERQGAIPILERRIYRKLGGRDVALYGDYSSIHPEIGPVAYGYVPRVDYPTPEFWHYFRKQDKPKSDGYIASAKRIMDLGEWDPLLEAWGVEQIARVAEGDATKMGSPANWIAVRVNLHLTQQTLNPPGYVDDAFEEEGIEDDENWAL
ncbi:MAG: protein beta [Pseudomonadota bacterium]